MSPQPTQAHLDKATCWIVKRPLNVSHQIDSLAQLIADSEAQAAKAECERLKQVKESYQERALTANNELARLRADLERFTGHGLLDCHAICDQRDAAVAERDQLRADRTYNHECINRLASATETLGEKSGTVVDVALSTIAQLRAEVERLTKQIKDDNRSYGCELRDPNGTIWEQAAKDHARAELAEASAKLWEADALRYANNTEFWKTRAEKAEAELVEWSRLKAWGGTPEIVHKFIKSQQNRIHYCQDLETELAKAEAELFCLRAENQKLWNEKKWCE